MMGLLNHRTRAVVTMVLAVPLLGLAGCELAPKTSTQYGFRGTGMNGVTLANKPVVPVPAPPYDPPPYGQPLTEAEKAGNIYQNVQVLGDVSDEQFNYTMAAITAWVSPEQGCNYCHNPENMASDEVYTKVVARKMLQMTRSINQEWTAHVKQTGVTCYTCHRGQPVPAAYWTNPEPNPDTIVNRRNGQNDPLRGPGSASLPHSSYAMYFSGEPGTKAARVGSEGMHPTPANTITTMETENNFAIMNHLSLALGVNCTYCHNANNFQSWNNSTPQRALAWHGIQMVGSTNRDYMTVLADVFPANRKGPTGDVFKVNCTTCHAGQAKPLNGVAMSKDYPALRFGPIDVPPMAGPAVGPAAATTAR